MAAAGRARPHLDRAEVIPTPWPDLVVAARDAGLIDPHDPGAAGRFRGEEAFDPEVTGWRRWALPSPEPALDAEIDALVLASIRREAPWISAAVARLADQVAGLDAAPPLLLAVLRAGVPVAALLSRALEARWGEPVPVAALSLFHGAGWDAAALRSVLDRWPGRPVWFVDGWTSGGGVARGLRASHAGWLAAGGGDFTSGEGPRLAVLCDPRGFADAAATRADRFVPSSTFTAPRTLGFSRGFMTGEGEPFRVYTFPRALWREDLVGAWLRAGEGPPSDEDRDAPPPEAVGEPPPGWRLHVNEVARALINRQPREVWLAGGPEETAEPLAPLLHLCRLRGVPVSWRRAEVAAWGATAAARMSGS